MATEALEGDAVASRLQVSCDGEQISNIGGDLDGGSAADAEVEDECSSSSDSSDSGQDIQSSCVDLLDMPMDGSGKASGGQAVLTMQSIEDCCCRGECGRPGMVPIQPGAKVFLSASSPCSTNLAVALKQAAQGTSRIHGYSTAGTPWLYARRIGAMKRQVLAACRTAMPPCLHCLVEAQAPENLLIESVTTLLQNEIFLGWCRQWISEVYGVCGSKVRAARTEPHVVKYSSSSLSKFRGIGTHQDGR